MAPLQYVRDVLNGALSFKDQMRRYFRFKEGSPAASSTAEGLRAKAGTFRRNVGFLIKMLQRACVGGSKPHLHDILVRLDFGSYFVRPRSKLTAARR